MYLKIAHWTIFAGLEVLHNTAFTNWNKETIEFNLQEIRCALKFITFKESFKFKKIFFSFVAVNMTLDELKAVSFLI